MPRTIGLDFGTHQTKVCVEEKDRFETRYSFVTFKDNKGEDSYVLPSIIRINTDGKLSYGYIKEGVPGKIVRYFKQATFTENPDIWKNDIAAEYYTVWYLAYILFILEEKYEPELFSLNFGIPTDNDRYKFLKRKAVSLLSSAYRLVEEVYKNNMEKFLDENILSLKENTEILSYSGEKKDFYNILVFPEAYACLRPLAARGRITTGMNLMVDIGGGTTDISFFTMEKDEETDKFEKPQLYELLSVPLGLNFLTKAEEHLDSGKLDSNVDTKTKLDWVRQTEYTDKISNLCDKLRQRILNLFENSTKLKRDRASQALKNRLIIYTGGGSAFSSLRRAYGGFTDIKHITVNEWGTYSFDDMEDIIKLCPILSTVFGLSISATSDKIKTKPLKDLFKHIKDAEEEEDEEIKSDPRTKSYKNDWMNKDYGVLSMPWTSSKLRSHDASPKTAKNSNNVVIINPSIYVPQRKEVIHTKLPKGDVSIETIPFSDIEIENLPTKRGVFTLANKSKTTCEYYGNIIIRDGLAYDIFYDNMQNLIIDFLHFEGKNCQRKTILAVAPVSPIYKAVKKYGYNRIKSIAKFKKTKKKKNRTIIKITINVGGDQYPKGSSITYIATIIKE